MLRFPYFVGRIKAGAESVGTGRPFRIRKAGADFPHFGEQYRESTGVCRSDKIQGYSAIWFSNGCIAML
ncbi:hypothetical protein LG35_08540 [Alistipes inops]|uniref:Uncharacterized protein n=1 Tax=Alistipes inops TaxID=1501391 RepID=A0ABR4YHD4_9BACT|nr:hypothetical protein LG35_08540 [Alistipes inops]